VLEPELPLEPELLLAPELPPDPEPAPVEPELLADPAFPELLLDPMLPGEPDAEPLLVPASVGVERPLSADELHAAEAEITAEKTRVDRICMELLRTGSKEPEFMRHLTDEAGTLWDGQWSRSDARNGGPDGERRAAFAAL
jgi:hypothetical protein